MAHNVIPLQAFHPEGESAVPIRWRELASQCVGFTVPQQSHRELNVLVYISAQ